MKIKLYSSLIIILLLTGCPGSSGGGGGSSSAHEVTSVTSSKTYADVGETLKTTANFETDENDILWIDPDGSSGSISPSSFNVSAEVGSRSVDSVFSNIGTYTPEAWFDSDGVVKLGSPVTIEDFDSIPTMNLRFGSISGGSESNYNVFAGEQFDVFLDANDDGSVSSIELYDEVAAAYYSVYDGALFNLSNGVSAESILDSVSGKYFLRFYGDGSNGTFEKTGVMPIKAKAKDNSNQYSLEDIMNITLVQAVAQVSVSGNGTLVAGGYSGYDLYNIQHRHEDGYDVSFTDVSSSDHDTVKWYVDSVYQDGKDTSKGGTFVLENIDFVADKSVKYELYKDGNKIAENATFVRGLNTAPEHPECDDADDTFDRQNGTYSPVEFYLYVNDLNKDNLTLEISNIDSSRVHPTYLLDFSQIYISIDPPTSGWSDSESPKFKLYDGHEYNENWEDITINVL